MGIKKLTVFSAFLIFGLVSSLQEASFDCTQTEQCQETIRIEMAKAEAGGLSRASEVEMCRDVREAMDCLVWISTSCGKGEEDRRRLGGVVMKARRFLESECEDEDGVQENWMDSMCYRNVNERCNEQFESRMSDKASQDEKCRIYENYKQCVDLTLATDKCSRTERLFASSFLLDRAKELAYFCPSPVQPRIQSLPIAQALASPDFLQSVSGFNWESTEQKLKNTFGQVACLKGLEEPVKKCTETYKEEIKEALPHANPTDKKGMERKQCCLFRDMEHCVEEAIKSSCGDNTENAVQKVVDNYKKSLLSGSCDDYEYGSEECSASAALQPLMTTIASLAAVVFSVKFLFMH